MTAREDLLASVMGLRTQGIPEWTARANSEIDAYEIELRREIASELYDRDSGTCGCGCDCAFYVDPDCARVTE